MQFRSKLILAALLAFCASPAFAAYVASNSAVGSSDSVTVASTGFTSGDEIILCVDVPQGSAATITWPAGFTAITSANNTGADRGVAQWLGCAWGTAVPANYTMIVGGAGGATPVGLAVDFSGRTTGAPTIFADTSNGNGGTTPVSVALTGVTAASNSDLIWVGVVNQTADVSAWTFTAPTGMTSRQTQNVGTLGGLPGAGLNLSTENAVSGATGTLTGTASGGTGSNADFLGVVIAISPSGGGTSKPVISNGKAVISGGKLLISG